MIKALLLLAMCIACANLNDVTIDKDTEDRYNGTTDRSK